jgi:2-keto-4-pentenoate hydratase
MSTHQRIVRDPRRQLAAADEVAAAADRLIIAAGTGSPCQPVRDLIGANDIAAAYRVQERLIGRKLADGHRRVGRKIGLTSPAVQAQLGVDRPDFGVLLDSMQVGPGDVIPAGRLLQPKIEAEIAFILNRDIDEQYPTQESVAAAVAVALAALEIVDSRIIDWDITIADTVADNASSGLFVLGEHAVALDDFDPVQVSMTLTEDGTVVSSGDGAACLGSPLLALHWLASAAASLGDPLRAGDIVLSGALGPMVPVTPGRRYEAQLSGLGGVAAVFGVSDSDAASFVASRANHVAPTDWSETKHHVSQQD